MNRANSPNSRRRSQCGQAIVLIVAVLPIVAFILFAVYSTAIATREKMKLQNTADAVTYSAAVLTARSLNYLAYTNRAMAANEASIATLASVQTTTGMLISGAANIQEGRVIAKSIEAARNLARSLDPLTGPAAFAEFLRNGIEARALQRTADRIADSVGPSAYPLQVAVDAIRVLNQGISASQAAMLASTTAQLPQVIDDVMRANDPLAAVAPGETAVLASKFVADLGLYLGSYHQSASGPYPDAERDEVLRFAHAAQATRDDWTKKRRFLPEWAKWIAVGLPDSLVEWKGGTELVAERSGIAGANGRIRWQSADVLEIGLPLGLFYTDIVGGAADIARGKFGLGAAAASAGGPDVRRSWGGRRLTLPTYASEARTYGGINIEADGTAEIFRGAFERATENRDGDILPGGFPALVFDARLHYGPRTDIGTGLTKDWPMPRFIDIKQHPPMAAEASDTWLARRGLEGRNPLHWGPDTDRGPALTMVLQKSMPRVGDRSVRIKTVSTAQVYFRRPQDRWARRDFSPDDPPAIGNHAFAFTGGYIEHRSLFSPYWHAHNIEPSPWARAVAMGGAFNSARTTAEDGE